LAETLNDEECGTPEDKLRLLLIHYLCSSGVTDEEVEKMAANLEVTIVFFS